MVDNCDLLIALWDGKSKSGTTNCVNYAKNKLKKDILIINPKTLDISHIENKKEDYSLLSLL